MIFGCVMCCTLQQLISMKIRLHYIVGLLIAVASAAFGQTATTYVASVSEVDRMTLVQANIPLTEWHAKSFWAQYNNYLEKTHPVSLLTYTTLKELAETNKTTDDQLAYQTGSKMITCRMDELSIRRQYFVEISREHNGVIALQFLQTEMLLDMLESVRIYEQTSLGKFVILPMMHSSEKSKYVIVTKVLSLSPEEALAFLPIYTRYENESVEILGDEYSMYELFAGEASDFTPSLARRQGYDLLTVMNREIRLKEKYFCEMNTMVGPSLATRFLAWEDYYSIMCKMRAWVEIL